MVGAGEPIALTSTPVRTLTPVVTEAGATPAPAPTSVDGQDLGTQIFRSQTPVPTRSFVDSSQFVVSTPSPFLTNEASVTPTSDSEMYMPPKTYSLSPTVIPKSELSSAQSKEPVKASEYSLRLPAFIGLMIGMLTFLAGAGFYIRHMRQALGND